MRNWSHGETKHRQLLQEIIIITDSNPSNSRTRKKDEKNQFDVQRRDTEKNSILQDGSEQKILMKKQKDYTMNNSSNIKLVKEMQENVIVKKFEF